MINKWVNWNLWINRSKQKLVKTYDSKGRNLLYWILLFAIFENAFYLNFKVKISFDHKIILTARVQTEWGTVLTSHSVCCFWNYNALNAFSFLKVYYMFILLLSVLKSLIHLNVSNTLSSKPFCWQSHFIHRALWRKYLRTSGSFSQQNISSQTEKENC